MTKYGAYGWKPDAPDKRDFLHRPEVAGALPHATDLAGLMPPVYDQGDLGSCTANAIAAAFDTERAIQGEKFMFPSRLAIYFNERRMEGDISEDGGAAIRDGIKTLNVEGVGPEKMWPYVISKFAHTPPAAYVKEALLHRAPTYARVPRVLTSMMQTLASGRPFVLGFTVYESFESPETADMGLMSMPEPGEQVMGGHAVVANGYKYINNDLHFKVRNSWGAAWGDHGHFWMPYQYLMNSGLSSDFWVLKTVSDV